MKQPHIKTFQLEQVKGGEYMINVHGRYAILLSAIPFNWYDNQRQKLGYSKRLQLI